VFKQAAEVYSFDVEGEEGGREGGGREREKGAECTLVQELRLCTGHMAHKGSGGIVLLFHDQRH
jgi:hypothetical protein